MAKVILSTVWIAAILGGVGLLTRQQNRLPPWGINHDGAFEMAAFDIEGHNGCISDAPWGSRSWGIEAANFTPNNAQRNAISWFRFRKAPAGVYLYGQELSGKWSYVRYVQGDAWGGTHCGDAPSWYIFQPVPVVETPLQVELDFLLDTHTLVTDDNSWLMFAVNLWFRSPAIRSNDLTQANQVHGNKPLVVDFVLHHECNLESDCGLRFFESDTAFHYMIPIDPDYSFENGMRRYIFGVNEHIREAVEATYLPECETTECLGEIPDEALNSLELMQFEFVTELFNAEGAAVIDNFFLKNLNE